MEDHIHPTSSYIRHCTWSVLPGLPPHICTASDKGWDVKAWVQGYLKCTQDFTDHMNKESIQVPLTNIQGILLSLHISRDGLQNIS